MIKPLGRHALDFFQIWNQKICQGKKKKLRRRRWQSRGCAKLKQQISNLAQIASHNLIFIFYFYFFFFLLFLLLLFLLFVETAVVSLSVWVGFELFFSYLCFQWHWFTWLDLEESRSPFYMCLALETRKLLIFETGKMFQPLDL